MSDRLHKLEQVFHAAVDLRQAGGNGALSTSTCEALCENDPHLAAELLTLLNHLDEAGEELDGSGAFLDPAELHGARGLPMNRDAALEEWGGAAVGQRIGEFVIIGQLGAGAMGIVYVAEQQQPRRPVALKVIRRAVATPAMIARFEREAELLARLNHPGIAQIYAAGIADVTTVDGRTVRVPYIAMEPVSGLPIAEFLRATRCEPNDVLKLMTQVCDAVQHAHQRGVIHRDLKPANLLVAVSDNDPRVKVVDFGVARGMESADDSHALTVLTAHGHLVGTPAYMSPEQIQGHSDAIDERCDVYALGAILFQLLSGEQAIELTGCTLPEATRRIVEEKPRRLGDLDQRFRGYLEIICEKALEKDRARRYASAADFARDLRHHIAGEPIEARRNSRGVFRGARAVQYRPWVLAASVLLILAALFAAYAHRRAELQQAADREASDAKRRADRSVAEMAEQLTLSRVEQARLLILEGDLTGAEEILWPEYFHHADSPLVLRGLWELYIQPISLRLSNGSPGECRASIFRPEGRTQAVGDDEGTVRISHPADLREGRAFPAGCGAVSSLQFNADGTQLLVSGTTGLTLLDARDGRQIRKFATGHERVNSADLSNDGKWIVSTGSDGAVRMWQVSTGSPVAQVVLNHKAGRCVRFDRKTTMIAVTFDDGNVSVCSIDWTHGKPVLLEPVKFPGHPDSSGIAVGFSPDGSIVASGATNGIVRLWSSRDGTEITVVRRAR